jgi:hypothetical protein
MIKHILQADHNQRLYSYLDQSFNGEFCDWQITMLFYSALHYLQALAEHRGISIGRTHHHIANSINPSSHEAVMRVTIPAFNNYRNLREASEIARYDGITDEATHAELKKLDLEICNEYFGRFKAYIAQFIPINQTVLNSSNICS